MSNNFKEGSRFVNPYNFIPLMGKCERSHPEVCMDDCYTGYFDCRIRLLTPLFIPNTSSESRLLRSGEREKNNVASAGYKGYDFFSYDDWSNSETPVTVPCKNWPKPSEPVIPGTEIRGAVRSVFEAAFNGCMSSVSVDRTFSRRSNEPKNPGILRRIDGKWRIQPCEKAMLNFKCSDFDKMGVMVSQKEYKAWKEGQEIWFRLNSEPLMKTVSNKSRAFKVGDVIKKYEALECTLPDSSDPAYRTKQDKLAKDGYTQGWLHKGERIFNKHHESVFYVPGKLKNKTIEVPFTSDISSLEKMLDEYHDAEKNKAMNRDILYPEYDVLPEGTLVYYKEAEDGHVYLSPACIGRELFAKTIQELLENNGDYMPCDGEALCPACKLFGMLEKAERNNTHAYGSKVRITDARLIHPDVKLENLFENPIILPELGEPKPGAVEFYTKSPYSKAERKKDGQGYWTYDYKNQMTDGRMTKARLKLCKGQPEIRGRKYYWHRKVQLENYSESKMDGLSSMRQRIRPLKAQAPDSEPLFSFRLYFEQVSKEQLSQLKWALDFGHPECAHKIGRAKPLGFGSVQVIVDALRLRKIDGNTGAWNIVTPELAEFFGDPLIMDEASETVQIMANWKDRPANVNYPSVEFDPRMGNLKKNGGASHQWFSTNRGSMLHPEFHMVLPEAKEDAMTDLESHKALFNLKK